MKKLILLCSAAAVFMPTAAFAQSTGTIETEEEAAPIVVTGTRSSNVDGIQVPDTTKAKAVITQELISKQSAGQTILNTLNLVPGVNFTQSDPYGSAGGNIRIRGFDGNRISLTLDGQPLNDTGNYAIYSNQQVDPELIEQVNVGLGVTDVDSPTASAAGGTVNYRTILPTLDQQLNFTGSVGTFDYRRLFGVVQTGTLHSSGTRAFLSGSYARNDKFKGPGEIYKRQANAKIYQPIGNNGDFITLGAHININRNNFFRNPSLSDFRSLFGTSEIQDNALANANNPTRVGYFSYAQEEAAYDFENLAECNNPIPLNGVVQNGNGGTGPNGTGPSAPAIAGSANNNPLNASACTNYFGVRVNPSDTGNIRGSSRFTLTDALTLTVDPSYQYTLAHGGGTTTLAENSARARGGSTTAAGVDYNGDGDILDTVRFFTPNITNTRRYGLTSSLIWDITREHRLRVAYTYDRGNHRQTGEWGYLEQDGSPQNIFSGRNGRDVLTADGFQIQQRDRKSIALLNQISGQYIGRFFDRALRVEVGVRRPFFKRDLETFCPIEARGSGFAYCTSETNLNFIDADDVVPTTGPTPYYRPFKAKYKFGKLLPNVGFTYNFSGSLNGLSTFGSYAKGFSAPRTDNLYRAPIVEIDPEETDAFDLGLRYTRRNVQAQLAAWKIDYQNRIVSSFNPDLGISLDRNIGSVDSQGVDANIAYQPARWISLVGLVSYIDTELKENVEIQRYTAPATGTIAPPAGLIFCGAAPTAGQTTTVCAPTAGKFVTETPKWQFGGRVNFDFNPFELGFQFKRVGSRFATDTNDVKVSGYTTVDADLRISAEPLGLKNTFFQVNVTNLTDQFYLGNIGTQIRANDNPNFTPAAPRTIMASLRFGI
ncbi:TonB-dependent receptor [Sphingomonas swuensis]|uniref:TonB-dependent receptor n=1 Tax=Sphingomonas swuensis TaxID=977800 RepID=A0ABP7SQB9_9SPHN